MRINKEFILDVLFISICLLVIVFCMFSLYSKNKIESKHNQYSIYEKLSKKIRQDPIIVNISNYCSSFENKPKCVFDNIPMNYDYSDAYKFYDFRSPEDYMIFGGVCRDVTILRYSALANLGIYCYFSFVPIDNPNHVFLLCYDNEVVYELNNGNFIIR